MKNSYTEIGYKTVEEAVKDFEKHFKLDLKLRFRILPLEFTHYFEGLTTWVEKLMTL
ncbi:hypothetical protein [Cytobacillus purgationiresistens]|uniref:hypothetical protein n=1 Tax=Cytobacillus purgationiresistens TaxID=863449 RepID=UPI0027D805EF|nr:hypothetical protein [Cytobacillus purgationiresistens]